METRRRQLERGGTAWPIPASWAQTGEDQFQGPEGLLRLTVEGEGALLDPRRVENARSATPGRWDLARTRNGTALAGDYRDRGARVLVYTVRADEADVPGVDAFSLPEFQVTYVLVEDVEAIAGLVREALQQQVIPSSAFGPLDAYGHAALGPVPMLGTWLPVGDFTDNTDTFGKAVRPAAYPMLVGGGWLAFSEDTTCCGVKLEPLAWRLFDEGRALERLGRELGARALTVRRVGDATAQAWQCRLGAPGLSYVAHDAQDFLRAHGAFWSDAFGQPWRLHYWLCPTHAREAERLLGACKP